VPLLDLTAPRHHRRLSVPPIPRSCHPLVELIDGEIVHRAPIGLQHADGVSRRQAG
jgi:hypothetical protein